MKFKSILLGLLLSSSACSFAEGYNDDDSSASFASNLYNYEFSADINHQTAFTGADLSMSFIEGYRMIDDKLGPESDAAWVKALMIIPRYMVTNYISTFQHEVFGHGARVREIGQGWKVKSYKVRFNGSGSTTYRYNTKANLHYKIAVQLGGTQATEVLSHKIKSRMMDSEKINPVYGAAYLVSSGDQLTYTFFTKYKEKSGHDIQDYITTMNTLYGKGYLSKAKVKSTAALGFLDPFLYYSAYALGTGEEFEYPMIPVGDYKYLPGFRGVFTPYGLEKKWLNYIKAPSTPIQFNLSHGTNKRGTSWSAEVIVDKIFSNDNIDFGLNIATWKQPKLLTDNPLTAPKRQGGSGEINIKLNLNETSSIYTAAGYKTPGFRVGYPMKACGLIRAGLAFKL